MTTLQVEYDARELLMDHEVAEPLIAGGVRCHGGFDAEGAYVSPRTRHRVPAIEAWQVQHAEQFGTPLIDVPLETWPEHFPNVAQARLLLAEGVPEPLIGTLTRIGTVEGLGANIRHLRPAGMQRHFVEELGGTGIDHLGRGLFEAHGRDEAGWEEEAGHRDMWFAARDVAFPGRTARLDVEAMLVRMGFGQGAGPGAGVAGRALPADVDVELEQIAALMIRVLLIEVQAFHTFAWAESWLSDPDLVAGDGEAARLVSYIRADETPHVAYLTTVLTEMRDRTWIGEGGARHDGSAMIGTLWARAVEQSLGAGRTANRAAVLAEVEHWCRRHPRGTDVLERFTALGTPHRRPEPPTAGRRPTTGFVDASSASTPPPL